jgi:hypothetical protein
MDRHAFNAAPEGEAGAGQSRRPPALTLEASPAQQGAWSTHQDPEAQAEPYAKAKAYRARMLAKVGNACPDGEQKELERGINFTDEELQGFIAHAEGLGFGQADVEAILAVKVRKEWVECQTLMEVADCLSKKRDDKRIRFKDGWDFMRAYREAQVSMLAGSALAPDDYLAVDYVLEHSRNFSGKASYLLPKKKFDRFVNPERTPNKNLGYNGALYVSSSAEIDRVLLAANGDISIVERLLGITPGSWQEEGPELYRVDIWEPEKKGLRIPHGLESSSNEFWTPGALTSGGTMEAVLDEVPRIVANHSHSKVIG